MNTKEKRTVFFELFKAGKSAEEIIKALNYSP